MANFTINSLSKTSVASTDSFIKSDVNGTLTRATPDELRTAILNGININHNYVTVGIQPAPNALNGTISFDLTGVSDYVIIETTVTIYDSGAGILATNHLSAAFFNAVLDGFSFGNFPVFSGANTEGTGSITGWVNLSKSGTNLVVKRLGGTTGSYYMVRMFR